MRKLTIWFAEDELVALSQLAQEYLRSPQEQAHWVLREQLRQLGRVDAQTEIDEEEVTCVTKSHDKDCNTRKDK